MPTNVTQISGATQADIYLGNYAYSDILASMAALRFKLDTAGTNRIFYKNAAGALFKVMCDASAGTNHASGRGLYTDANGAAQSSSDFRFSGLLLGIGDAINGITTSHHITVGDAGAADYPQILIGKDTDNFFQVFHDNQNGYFALQQKAGGVTYSNMIVGKLGNIGVGTATPDNKLHAEISDSGTNTILYPFKISRATSGTPAANIGVGMTFEAETKYGTTDGDLTARIRTYWTDAVTSMGEDSAMGIDVYSNDSFVEALQLRHNCAGMYVGMDTLEAWTIPSLAVGDASHGIFGATAYDGSFGLFDNIYFDGAWKLANADYGSRFELEDGAVFMYVFGTGAENSEVSTTALVKLNTAGVLNGYSDAGSTQTWSIACATGAAQFDGEVKADGNSKVEASSTTAQSMANGAYTDFVFEIEDKDLLAEYDKTTGIFTAGKAGTYAVSWHIGSASAAWDAGEYWQSLLSRNDSTSEGDIWLGFTDINDAAITRAKYSNGSAIVTLAATNTLRIKVAHNQGGAVNTNGLEQTCYFHIARVA